MAIPFSVEIQACSSDLLEVAPYANGVKCKKIRTISPQAVTFGIWAYGSIFDPEYYHAHGETKLFLIEPGSGPNMVGGEALSSSQYMLTEFKVVQHFDAFYDSFFSSTEFSNVTSATVSNS